MRLHAFLGLSEFDMGTFVYYGLAVALCILVNFFIMWYENSDKEANFIFFMAFRSLDSVITYLFGFLSGIVIARSSVQENLESLKPCEVSDIPLPLSVI